MPQYIAKEIKDVDGNITGYNAPVIVSGIVATKAGEVRFIHTEKYRYAKIDFINNEWVVVEDTESKEAVEAKEVAASDLKKRVRVLATDLQAASTVNDLKPIIRDLGKIIMHLAENIKEL